MASTDKTIPDNTKGAIEALMALKWALTFFICKEVNRRVRDVAIIPSSPVLCDAIHRHYPEWTWERCTTHLIQHRLRIEVEAVA